MFNVHRSTFNVQRPTLNGAGNNAMKIRHFSTDRMDAGRRSVRANAEIKVLPAFLVFGQYE
jgi:hypothetical protein